jgi:hypothetical protein
MLNKNTGTFEISEKTVESLNRKYLMELIHFVKHVSTRVDDCPLLAYNLVELLPVSLIYNTAANANVYYVDAVPWCVLFGKLTPDQKKHYVELYPNFAKFVKYILKKDYCCSFSWSTYKQNLKLRIKPPEMQLNE